MSFAQTLKNSQRARARLPRQCRPRARQRLFLEYLEERAVPTILWSSAGSRSVLDSGGPVLTHVDVDLVFWGAGWYSSQARMDQVTSSVQKIMDSPYLSGLSQYRGIGNGQLLRTDLITCTSPAPQTKIAQFNAFVKASIDDGELPVTPDMDDQLLYVVIPQPGTRDDAEQAGGSHGTDLSKFGRYQFAWTINYGNLDAITYFYSHELTESVTDPQVNYHLAFWVPSTLNEICDGTGTDGEAQLYSYRLNGVLVQSSLSEKDHAYAVYDGSTQNLALSSSRVLTLNGGQLPNVDDMINIDQENSGYKITLNGESFQFDSREFLRGGIAVSSITVNTGSGNDTLNIESTISGLPLTINLGDGSDTVNLSPTAQNLGNVLGTVTVNGGSGTDTLNFFDQGINPTENYTLTNTTVARPGMGTVTYHKISNLVLNTSNGTDTITVKSTPPGTQVAINGGSGDNTLVGSAGNNVWSITGKNSGTVSSSTIAGPVLFSAVQNLIGGSAMNAFVFSDGAGISGKIDGGGAGALDYSTYSTSVIVDLQMATATGVGGSIANIQNVKGGNGGGAGIYNILVGTGGNSLTGGNGRRNLLIAGSSASTLVGGDDEDILIGGTTAYDMDVASLLAIMNYWSGTSADYATRVGNLLAGTGVPVLNANTVVSNGGGNILTGSGGLNLYYGSTTDTTDFDPSSGSVFVSV